MNLTAIDRLNTAKLVVCDMDGTVYLGNKVLPGALSFVENVRRAGKRFVFFTNNASKRREDYSEKLERLGFGQCEIMTAGDVTVSYLNSHYKGESVYVLGTEALKQSMLNGGIKLTDRADARILVSSFDTELTYEKLCIACDCLRGGAVFLSTHPDYNCPTENGFIPDSGAIAALLTASTGKTPKYLGKPYKETAEAIAALTGIPSEQTVSVGDRLYTDIALAKNSGMLSVLVLSGETAKEDITPENAPDIVVDGVGDIAKLLSEMRQI